MKLFSRCHITLFLTAVYTLIIMSPLAPLTMRYAAITHGVTGECVGDCAVCGCSPEQSVNRTCCCWKKKLQDRHEHEADQALDCCKKNKQDSKPVLSCGCPYGGNKLLAFWGGETFEQLPYHFSEDNPAFHPDDLSTLYRNRLTNRHSSPPDPPPKLVILS